jgi:hypothetical protein
LELSHRIWDAEKAVQRLVVDDFQTTGQPGEGPSQSLSHPDSEAQQQRNTIVHDAGSDDDDDSDGDTDDTHSVDALEDRFHALKEEVATLVADVHDLALYTKLNITGFMKILKVLIHYFCRLMPC